jgi:hypothetical protein
LLPFTGGARSNPHFSKHSSIRATILCPAKM